VYRGLEDLLDRGPADSCRSSAAPESLYTVASPSDNFVPPKPRPDQKKKTQSQHLAYLLCQDSVYGVLFFVCVCKGTVWSPFENSMSIHCLYLVHTEYNTANALSKGIGVLFRMHVPRAAAIGVW
jgi:hypothetical protein